VTILVKRGTARRLGLWPWPGEPIPLGEVTTPDGTVHRIALVGSRRKPTYIDQRRSASTGPPVRIGPGALGSVHIGETRLG
jgi:hypothetical protein